MFRAYLWALALQPKSELTLSARVALLRVLLPRRFKEVSLPELLQELTPRVAGQGSARQIARIEEVTEQLLRQSRILRTTCLYRALIRYLLLREAGVDVVFAMGVRSGESDLIGHAWLEQNGQPFRERLPVEYARTFTHPSS